MELYAQRIQKGTKHYLEIVSTKEQIKIESYGVVNGLKYDTRTNAGTFGGYPSYKGEFRGIEVAVQEDSAGPTAVYA